MNSRRHRIALSLDKRRRHQTTLDLARQIELVEQHLTTAGELLEPRSLPLLLERRRSDLESALAPPT